MPKRKIEGTLELAEGLLLVANRVDAPGARDHALSAMGAGGCMPKNRKDRQLLGKYQGRVVLAALAAELALKYTWEHEPTNAGKPFPRNGSGHQLSQIFNKLSCACQKAIEAEYLKVSNTKTKCITAEEAFGQYEKPFEEFRYIGEYPLSKKESMRATDLIQATKSVITVARARHAKSS